MINTVDTKIRNILETHSVVLFMKGTAIQPQCGFSALAKNLLELCGLSEYHIINVLENPELREGIKLFSRWPTIPQLYIQEEFIGGSDIMQSMYNDGSLKKLLEPIINA